MTNFVADKEVVDALAVDVQNWQRQGTGLSVETSGLCTTVMVYGQVLSSQKLGQV